MKTLAAMSTPDEPNVSEEKKRTPEQQKRIDRHNIKKDTAIDRLREKVSAMGDDALLEEYETAAFLDKSVQWVRNDRLYGASLPYIKIGSAVRYRVGAIKERLSQKEE